MPRSASPPSPSDASPYGIRLALKDVHGISDAEIRSILGARSERPFTDLGDFSRRTRVSQPVTEAIAHAGGFDALLGGSRRDRLFEAMIAEPQREGDQLALPTYPPLSPGLSDYTDPEKVRAELEVLGVDASRHLISFFGPLMDELGVTRARDLRKLRANAPVTVAGVKVSSQTPGVRSGQRIIFLTLDDGTGPVETTIFPSAQDACARIAFHSYVMAIRGTLRRTGVAGVSVVAEEAFDLVAIAAERGLGPETAVPTRRVWHSSPGSAG